MLKKFLVLTLVLMLVVCCGVPSSLAAEAPAAKLRVAWWGNQVRNDRTTETLALYSEQNPGVTFETEFTDWSGYWDKLAVQAASNSLPDIIQQDYSYIKQYHAKDQLASLDEFVASGLIDLSKCDENLIASGRIDGSLYAIPLGMNAPALIYDKAAAEAAGVEIKDGMTFAELDAAAEKIYAATGMKYDLGYGDGTNIVIHVGRGAGYNVLVDGGLDMKSAEDLLPFFQLHADSVKKPHYMTPEELSESFGVGIEMDPLSVGKNWMSLSWSNQYVAFCNAAGRELGMVSWPTGENDTGLGMYYKPSMFLSISANSTNKEAAARVIDFFTNSIDANKILLGERGVPISSVVAEEIKPLMGETLEYVFNYLNVVADLCGPIPPPTPAGASELTVLCDSLVEQVCYGTITPEQAAERFFTEGNEILAKAAAGN